MKNLIVWVQVSWSLSTSDYTPAGFYVKNLENIYQGNRVAGSEGHGFWIDMLDHIEGEMPGSICPSCKVPPAQGFDDNGAHSGVRHGLFLSH